MENDSLGTSTDIVILYEPNLTKIENDQVTQTVVFVKEQLQNAEGGHDWYHIQRVCLNSFHIASSREVDYFVIVMGALLHDIADAKFHKGDETIGPQIASNFMEEINVSVRVQEEILHIIKNISFRSSNEVRNHKTIELQIVQDADRLDAIGAIGIARCFNYGGFKNRKLYDPDIIPNPKLSKEAYKKSQSPSINHFYEKLLTLKDQMNTDQGRLMAEERHQFMQIFLNQFYLEWDAKATLSKEL